MFHVAETEKSQSLGRWKTKNGQGENRSPWFAQLASGWQANSVSRNSLFLSLSLSLSGDTLDYTQTSQTSRILVAESEILKLNGSFASIMQETGEGARGSKWVWELAQSLGFRI